MALDKELNKTINLTANGDQLLKPLEAFGAEINKTIAGLHELSAAFSSGNSKSENQLRSQVQLLQRLIGEASTLQNLLNTKQNERQGRLMDPYKDAQFGKQAAAAAGLQTQLRYADTAAQALSIRLGKINQAIGEMGRDGVAARKSDLTKRFNTEQALKQVQQLDRELTKMDSKAASSGGYSKDSKVVRDQVATAQSSLLAALQNNKRVNFGTEIAQVQTLTERLREMGLAEVKATNEAAAAQVQLRARLRDNILTSDAQLRAMTARGASRFSYTPEQARGFNSADLTKQIEGNLTKLTQLRTMMDRALNPENPRAIAVLEHLQKSWEAITLRTSEAIAQQRAYNNLPEQRRSAATDFLFGDGGIALGSRMAGAIGIGMGIQAVIGAATGGVTQVLALEDALAKLQAISGSTNAEMGILGKGIMDLGNSSRYALSDIAESATQIAQAGYSALETIGVLKSSLTLATASGSSPAEAVDTVTSALGAFQLQASESDKVVDTLVQGLNRSKLSISQMQAAIQYVGATAKESNIDLQELVTITSSLANAGIRSGSTIGTGLRQLIVDMQKPTDNFKQELNSLGLTLADVDVKALGVAGVVKKLTDAGFSAEAAYRSFENRAASSFLAFRNQIDSYDDLALAIAQSGAAQQAEAAAMESLSAKWNTLKNNLVSFLSEAAAPVVKALGLVVDIVNAVVRSLNSMSDESKLAAEAIVLLTMAMNANPIVRFASLALALATTLGSASSEMDRLSTASSQAQQAFKANQDTIAAVDNEIQRLISRQASLSTNHTALMAEVANLSGRFKGLAGELSGVALTYDNLVKAMLRYRGEALRQAGLNAEHSLTTSTAQKQALAGELTSNANFVDWAGSRNDLANAKRPTAGAINWLRGVQGRDYTNATSESLLREQNDVQAGINTLEKIQDQDATDKAVLKLLNERLATLQKMAGAQGQIDIAQRDMGIYGERASAAGQERDAFSVSIDQGITKGMQDDKDGSGKGQALISSTMDRANARIAQMRAELKNVAPTSAKATVLQDSITELEAIVARVASADGREGTNGQKPGQVLNSNVVASMLRSQYRGANVYGVGNRSYTEQVQLYNDYKAGKGPLAAKPGKSLHGNGHAVDITPIKGMTLDDVVAFLEGKGLNVIEALNEKDPKTGRYHWHIGWEGKKSKLQTAQEAQAAKDARELQDLLNQRASSATAEASSAISTMISQAKGGALSIPTIDSQFSTVTQNYSKARLAEFDTKNPTAGMSKIQLTARSEARDQLVKEITQNIEKYKAELWRAISDYSGKVLQDAMQRSQQAFDRGVADDQKPVALIQARGEQLKNRVNAREYGAGAEYLQNRQLEDAQLTADQQKLTRLLLDIDNDQKALEARKAAFDRENPAPGSENYLAGRKQIEDAQASLASKQDTSTQLQTSIASRTTVGVEGLGSQATQLKAAAQAWIEVSGAMDSWAKTVQNNVGPVLDQLVSGLSDMFTNLATGQATIMDSLRSFGEAFGKFILNIIAKALMLQAVKGLLSLVGLNLDSMGGIGKAAPKIGYDTTGLFDGGMTGAPANDNKPIAIPGRYNGGPIGQLAGGGQVTTGVPTQDSTLYNLSRDEFVVRNKSVRELGLPFMNAINKHGSKGLAKMTAAGAGSAFAMQPPARQETNVYVVQDQPPAAMGPSDVLVAVHRDILANGTTKKLIRQVAQGG